ncbi:MAG: bacteriocin immunity protein [Lactobacillaceae bacterium]|jgi:hypothetical protein|nr:bacteriocin immunity protein [Lactobacillaceae bacterium]
MTNEKIQTIMQLIDAAYGDAEVKKFPDLQKLLMDWYKDLQNDEPISKVFPRMKTQISWYALEHEGKLPQAIGKIFNAIAVSSEFYEGTAFQALMLGNMF